MICPKCNAENNEGVRFCVNCGAEIAPESNPVVNNSPANQEQAYRINQPTAPAAPAKSPSNGLSVAALVCGLLGIIGSFIPIVKYFTLVLAILGIVFGVIGKKKAAEAGNTNTGLATAGLVLGIIGTAFSAVGVICALACVGAAGAAAESAGIAANDILNSAAESLKETVTQAASEAASSVADKIASSAADAANKIASSAADEAAKAASDAADSIVKSLFN